MKRQAWCVAGAIGSAAGLAVTSLAMTSLAGCGLVCDGTPWTDSSPKELRELHIAHKGESPLVVVTGNGSIDIVKGGSENVTVRATVRARDQERLAKIKVVAERKDDGTLVVSALFPDGKPKDRDGVSLEVVIPDAKDLTLRSSNGPIAAEGFSGKGVAHTSNGRITLKKHAGDAVLDTSNGAIEATDVSGSITVDTSNGAIKLTDVGSPVVADTSNGAIEVVLRDDAPGPVTLDTSNGRINLTLGSAFGGTIVADTSNGAVNINQGAAPWTISKKGKTHATIQFGSGDKKSEIDTSNGSITIAPR